MIAGESNVSWRDLRKTAEDATKPLPAGWYEARVAKAEATKASTGKDMIRITMEVTAGPHQGRQVFTQQVFSPENAFALNLFFRAMGAFGLGDSFFDAMSARGLGVDASMQEIANALVDRHVRVELGMRQFQGQDRNEVTQYGVSATPQPPAQLGFGGPSAGPPTAATATGPTANPGPATGPVLAGSPGPIAGPSGPVGPPPTAPPTPGF